MCEKEGERALFIPSPPPTSNGGHIAAQAHHCPVLYSTYSAFGEGINMSAFPKSIEDATRSRFDLLLALSASVSGSVARGFDFSPGFGGLGRGGRWRVEFGGMGEGGMMELALKDILSARPGEGEQG